MEQIYRNPVIPDSVIIRVESDYYAIETTSDFVPNYLLFHSKDLIKWERIDSVFDNPLGY
jgi:beta-xylosidase